jgi:hypothetical protein
MSEETGRKTFIEQIEVAGDQLLDRIKEILHEGNVRHIRIMHDGREVLEIPITLAVVGGLIAPVLAALGAFAAAVTKCTIEIVREEPAAGTETPGGEISKT